MEVLGLISARGGSKGIPRKNITPIAGRPLLAYTADAALRSTRLARTVLSTDDPGIAAVGRALGLEVPFLRPARFARDDSPAIDLVRHALAHLREHDAYEPDAVMLLQPTSPLRRAEHIDAAVEIMERTGADAVVSVMPVPHQFNPVSVMRLEDGRLTPFDSGPLITRRQDKPVVYARNGPAILVSRTDVIQDTSSLYGDDVRPYIMSPHDSIDIDEPEDIELAEYRLTHRSAA